MQFCANCSQSLFTPRIRVDLPSLRDQLRTECGPASVRQEEVDAILQSAQRDLEDYDQEIRRLDSRRRLLLSQQEKLREYTSLTRYLLSPIRKLPDEILHHVFDECCDINCFRAVDERSFGDAAEDIRMQPALTLSRLSYRWRRIALDLARIWSRISLDWKRESDVNVVHDYPEKALEKFITRSKQVPLHIIINTNNTSGFHDEHKPLSLLVAEHLRWRTFVFRSRSWLFEELFTSAAQPVNSLPLLLDLEISNPVDFDLEFLIGKTPRLRSFKIPLDGITGPYLSPERFFRHFFPGSGDAIATYTSLASLEIDEIVFRDVDDGSAQPKVVSWPRSSLVSLVVHHCGASCSTSWQSVFGYFTLPSLKTIWLRPGSIQTEPANHYWVNFEVFTSFLKRSSCPLVVLSIEGLALLDLRIIDILLLIPTLCDLTIDDTLVMPNKSPITVRLVEALHASRKSFLRQQSQALLPKLRSLTLSYGGQSFKDEVVIDMVQSRWIPDWHAGSDVDCLRGFTLNFRERQIVSGAYSELDKMEQDGLRAVVKWKED